MHPAPHRKKAETGPRNDRRNATEKSDDETADESKADDAEKSAEAATAEEETKPASDKEAEVKNIIAERTRIEQENSASWTNTSNRSKKAARM